VNPYKEALTAAMVDLATDPAVRFIGYGVKIGGGAHGTLKSVSESQLIETPVAENLMVGLAIGMSLAGLRPVVFIERFDFILNALDAIVNHLDKIETMSRGQFKPAVILRVVVGNKDKPFFTGATHTQDFTVAIKSMLTPDFLVHQLFSPQEIAFRYDQARAYQVLGRSTVLIEYKDLLL
jgi:pyruvate/2-oxoglutarate/acetoin dehydrogenase E1 component